MAKEWKRRAWKAGREEAGKAVSQGAGRERGRPEREARKRKREAEEHKLGENHGHRYYEWRLDEAGQLEYGESANCEQERRREGHWLLEMEEEELGAVEAVRAYQDLWRVKAAYRTLKDVLELRPVRHRREERVRAHMLVASLAHTGDRPGVGEEVAEGGAAAEHAGGVGGHGAGESGGVRDEGEGTQAGSVREQIGGAQGPAGAGGEAGGAAALGGGELTIH